MPQAESNEAGHRQHQLNRIAEAVTSGSEKRLLNALTKAAAELTGMQIAVITVIDEDSNGTVTAAFPRDSGLVGHRYYIPTSPCSFSLEHETRFIPSGLAAAYPREPTVTGAGLQAYVGRRLVDNDGRTLGIFALMDTRPIEDDHELLSVLEVLAARAAAELQREQTHHRLLQQEARLNVALENGEQLIWEWEVESDRYLVYEPATVNFEHVATTGKERMRLVHPDDARRVAEARQAYFRGQRPVYEYEARYLAPHGEYRWIFVRGKASERFDDGRVRRLMGTHTDITALKTAEQAHANSRALFALVLDTVPQYVYWKDRDSVYQGANRKFAELTGVNDPEKLVGMTDEDLWWGVQATDIRARDSEVINGRVRQMRMERELEAPGGQQRWFEITRAPMRAADGSITGMLGSMHDITERKLAENEAQRLALYDPLTELPNRRYLIERLRTAIAAAERHGGMGALLFIDLDQFKQINDSLGHAVGDQLLRVVARRLQKATRQEDMVARLGGDEFVVLLPSVGQESHSAALQSEITAEKIAEVLSEQYVIADQTFHVTPTTGIAMFPEPGKSADDVLKEADTAMYSGKAEGRNAIRFFHPDMEASARYHLVMERDLRAALQVSELDLHYQPQVDGEGRIIGAEALLRWTHPVRGPILPGEFIPMAEERGLIVELGNWVFDRAFSRLRDWSSGTVGYLPLLSINVSSRQFRHPDFVRDLTLRLRDAGLPPERIMLEITESTVMDDLHGALDTMLCLKALGFRFSLDDFGVGYSSLSQLKQLPFDQLKIDQSFIRDIGQDADGEIICQTIIAMGESLGMQTIAEGVEEARQFEVLKALDCDGFQGYHFAPPVAEPEFVAFVSEITEPLGHSAELD